MCVYTCIYESMCGLYFSVLCHSKLHKYQPLSQTFHRSSMLFHL